jgi:catechol 2,3-dioxygenase-like lactoylglutathione lyase family enzyme
VSGRAPGSVIPAKADDPRGCSSRKKRDDLWIPACAGMTMKRRIGRSTVMAKIRHLAFFADNPEEMAKFYVNAFGFEITGRGNASVWLTDGYLDIVPLKRADNMRVHTGLDHFGITLDVEEQSAVYERLEKMGHAPFKPPSDRSYVEDYWMDVERNKFAINSISRPPASRPTKTMSGVQGTVESLIDEQPH